MSTLSFLSPAPYSAVQEIIVKSPAFGYEEPISKKYTADGANVNPALVLLNLPDETQSMVLMVEDPDAPIDTWVHWLVWNIYPTTKIQEDSIPGVEGINAFRQHHYNGPCPPSGTHNYFFKVFALDTFLNLPNNSTKREVILAIKNHVLGYGELIGTYSRYNHHKLDHTFTQSSCYR